MIQKFWRFNHTGLAHMNFVPTTQTQFLLPQQMATLPMCSSRAHPYGNASKLEYKPKATLSGSFLYQTCERRLSEFMMQPILCFYSSVNVIKK